MGDLDVCCTDALFERLVGLASSIEGDLVVGMAAVTCFDSGCLRCMLQLRDELAGLEQCFGWRVSLVRRGVWSS